jgi:hypothetical protein
LLNLLRELPGYTRRELEAEPAQLLERWMIYLGEEAKARKKQQKQ